jgi:hypothetical protein
LTRLPQKDVEYVDGSKPCWSLPQAYEWLGAFSPRRVPKVCQSKDRKQTAKVLYLTYRSNPIEVLIAYRLNIRRMYGSHPPSHKGKHQRYP